MGLRQQIKSYPQHVVYVTRPEASGQTYNIKIGTGWLLFLLLAGQIAAALWVIIAVVEAVAHIVGWF